MEVAVSVTPEPDIVEDRLSIEPEPPVLGDDDISRLPAEPEGELFTITGLPVIDEAVVLEYDKYEDVCPELMSEVSSRGLPVMEVEFAGDDAVEPAGEDDELLESSPEVEVDVEFPPGLSSRAPQTPLLVTPASMASFI